MKTLPRQRPDKAQTKLIEGTVHIPGAIVEPQRAALLNPIPGNLLLVVAPRAGGAILLDLAARLARRGPLRLLDGGNRLDVYALNLAVARALDRGGPGGSPGSLREVLERIQLARAFTCYQLVALLRDTPAAGTPTIVLDLLATFYDESVPAVESRRLLRTCIVHLARLNRAAPVAVSARPAMPVNRPELLEFLAAAAGQVWMLEPEAPREPPRLF
jgi:hypothetical protein